MNTIISRESFRKEITNKKGQMTHVWTSEGVHRWGMYALHNPEARNEIHIHAPTENIKLSALMWSTLAGPASAENGNLGSCSNLPCLPICYAVREQAFRPTALLAHMENAIMVEYEFDRCCEELAQKIWAYDKKCQAACDPTMVRWHESGEFTPNDSKLLDTMAEEYKKVSFYGYTKLAPYYEKYYEVDEFRNINIMWSAWRGLRIPPQVLECGPLKAFFVKFRDGNNSYIDQYIPDGKFVKCPGLIKGKSACNECHFACSRCVCVVADEH